MEFLDIELSKEEQLSYFASKDSEFKKFQASLSKLLEVLNRTKEIPNLSMDKLQEFKNTLEAIVGNQYSYFAYGNSLVDRLRVPIGELKQFQEIIGWLTGFDGFRHVIGHGIPPLRMLQVPLEQLREFKLLLDEIVGSNQTISYTYPQINRLNVPIDDLRQYNETLNETLIKLREINILRGINP